MSKTWIEVALNGPWSRARQPGIPITVDECVREGIACVEAGAAIVHVHAYDPSTGRQNDDPDIYSAIIEGIKGAADAIVYPTIPFAGSVDAPGEGSPSARFVHIAALADRGLLEWAVVDPGTVNISDVEEIAADREGFVYLNPESHIRAGLALAEKHRIHPSYAIYEPGFLRLGAALARRYPNIPIPIYRFMFSDRFTFSFGPEPYALDAYLQLLEREAAGAPWMVAGLNVDISPLIGDAVARGGHVRVGLEDAPLGDTRTNVEWVALAAKAIEASGGNLATAADVRAELRDTGG